VGIPSGRVRVLGAVRGRNPSGATPVQREATLAFVSARRLGKREEKHRGLSGSSGSGGFRVHRQVVDASAPPEVPSSDCRRFSCGLGGPLRTGESGPRSGATPRPARASAHRCFPAQGDPSGGPSQTGKTRPCQARCCQKAHSGPPSRSPVLTPQFPLSVFRPNLFAGH